MTTARQRTWVNVFLQGADVENGRIKLTGSYNIVSLGRIRVEELYTIVEELARLTSQGYPQTLTQRDDFCPASVTAEAQGRIVTVWFPEEGGPRGFYWTEHDGWEYEFHAKTLEDIRAAIAKYLVGEDTPAPPLVRPVYTIRVRGENSSEKLVFIDLHRGTLAGIRLDSIEHVTIHSGGGILRRPPQLEITYRNHGKKKTIRYQLATKQTLERDVRALQKALGPNRVHQNS